MRVINSISQRFQQDYNNIKDRIDKITSETDKAALHKMLNTLALAVSDIETAHEAALFGNTQKIKSIADNRERVTAIRKQIEQKLSALNV
jgi:hypothetical protein